VPYWKRQESISGISAQHEAGPRQPGRM